jgi:hypothetical protein
VVGFVELGLVTPFPRLQDEGEAAAAGQGAGVVGAVTAPQR